MKVELPEFKRCCFCVPLRYGLLAWAYIKLILLLPMTLYMLFILSLYIRAFVMGGFYFLLVDLLLASMVVLGLLLDIAFTIVFIVGGHQKNVKLLRVFFIYSVVSTCLSGFALLATTAFELYQLGRRVRPDHTGLNIGLYAVTKIFVEFVFIAIQAYFSLLIRSEINKLRNQRNFRFYNPRDGGECAMEAEAYVPEHITDVQTNEEQNPINEPILETERGSFNYGKLENKIPV